MPVAGNHTRPPRRFICFWPAVFSPHGSNPKVAQRVAELKERIKNGGIASAARVLQEAYALLCSLTRRRCEIETKAKTSKLNRTSNAVVLI